MHFEILIEDQSGKKALEYLVPKIIGDRHTYNIHPYKGIGRIPKKLGTKKGSKRSQILLNNLPQLLRGYGKTHAAYGAGYQACVILVCDLDSKCLNVFRNELEAVLNSCTPKPKMRFCIAIEEGEAWFLGDLHAIRKAYPKANNSILTGYVNDSICGTWEKLADAVYSGGSSGLSSKGWQAVGVEKSSWAEKISPHMDVNNNNSLSFCYFRDKLRELAP